MRSTVYLWHSVCVFASLALHSFCNLSWCIWIYELLLLTQLAPPPLTEAATRWRLHIRHPLPHQKCPTGLSENKENEGNRLGRPLRTLNIYTYVLTETIAEHAPIVSCVLPCAKLVAINNNTHSQTHTLKI